MKKLLFLCLCLLTSIMTKAQTTYTYSGNASTTLTVSADGTTATLNVATAGDFSTWYTTISSSSEAPNTATLNGVTTKLTVIGNVNGDDLSKIEAFFAAFVDLSGATIAEGGLASLKVKGGWVTNYTTGLKLPSGTDLSSINVSNISQDGRLLYYYCLGTSGTKTIANLYITSGNLLTAFTNATELKTVYSLTVNNFSTSDVAAINNEEVNISILTLVDNANEWSQGAITNSHVKFLDVGKTRYSTSRKSGIAIASKINEKNESTDIYYVTAYNGTPGGDLADILTGYEKLNPYKLSVEGELDAADFGKLIHCAAKRLNIENATVASGVNPADLSFTGISNDTIEYAVLTKGLPSIPLSWAEHFPNFKAGISYSADNTSVVGYVTEAGTLNEAMAISALDRSKLTSVTLSGNLKACDIAHVNGSINSNGNIYELTSDGDPITTGTGVAAFTGTPGLSNAYNIKTVDFTHAVFALQRDMNIAKIVVNANNLTSVALPTSTEMDSIPSYCFYICTSLTKICIPKNYKYICDYSFNGDTSLKEITTTITKADKVEEYGHGDNSFTFSDSLKYIGTKVFYNVTKVSDVYCMATTAPECMQDAFDGATLYGNNSFSSTAPITQASYTNNVNPYAVLHFPLDVTDAEAKNYTDVTRVYSIVDEKQTTDGKGQTLVWPTQLQFNRSIGQANTGYIWKDWIDTYWPNNPTTTVESSNVVASPTRYNKDKYCGWHQFTLTASYNYSNYSDEPQWDFSQITDNEWWTICLPFSLKKSELLTIFGNTAADGTKNYPKVCTLTGVTRNSVYSNITLKFGNDLVAAAAGDDSEVIVKGYAYMIKPNMNADSIGTNFVPQKHVFAYTKSTATGLEFPIFTNVTALDQNSAETDWSYSFRGTYVDNKMPAYAFFLGWDTTNSRVAYYYQPTESTKKSWNAYTSIIGAKLAATQVPTSGSVGESNYVAEHYDIKCSDDISFTTGSNAKVGLVFNADDSTPTKINGVEIDNAAAYEVTGKVYNMNGQQVDANGSLNTLKKGIYVMNGKKYIVK